MHNITRDDIIEAANNMVHVGRRLNKAKSLPDSEQKKYQKAIDQLEDSFFRSFGNMTCAISDTFRTADGRIDPPESKPVTEWAVEEYTARAMEMQQYYTPESVKRAGDFLMSYYTRLRDTYIPNGGFDCRGLGQVIDSCANILSGVAQ